MTRVVIYTTVPLVKAGIENLFAGTEDLQLVAVLDSLEECAARAEREFADIIFIDMDTEFDIGTLIGVMRRASSAKLVLWVQDISLEMAHALQQIGVRAILKKQSDTPLLLRCLRKVAEGELWFERSLLSGLLGTRKVSLSPRESELLSLVCQGRSNKDIADELGLSEGTVKVYFSKLFKKVGLSDRFELALYGLRNMPRTRDGVVVSGIWGRSAFIRATNGSSAPGC